MSEKNAIPIQVIAEPTKFSDNFTVTVRSDGMTLFRFFSTLPEMMVETSRFVMSTERSEELAHKLIETIELHKKAPQLPATEN